MAKTTHSPYVLCIDNKGYEASLELLKLYRVIADPVSRARHFLRVVDESGEDYLFPEKRFSPVRGASLPRKALKLLRSPRQLVP